MKLNLPFYSTNQELLDLRNRMDTAFQALSPFVQGVEVEVEVKPAGTQITHGLKRRPQGFLVLDKTANATVWRSNWDEVTATFHGSVLTKVKIWLY